MLYELHIKYIDGRTERPIVYIPEGEVVKIYPQRDNITAVSCKRFRYHVTKHNTLPISIVKLGDKTLIYPSKIECHPKTTLDDIVEIKPKIKQPIQQPKPIVEFKTWEFKSSSSDGKYIVRETIKGLKCDCSGFWRVKDKEKGCKHIQEVRKNIN
jgi:hypothetical protein